MAVLPCPGQSAGRRAGSLSRKNRFASEAQTWGSASRMSGRALLVSSATAARSDPRRVFSLGLPPGVLTVVGAAGGVDADGTTLVLAVLFAAVVRDSHESSVLWPLDVMSYMLAWNCEMVKQMVLEVGGRRSRHVTDNRGYLQAGRLSTYLLPISAAQVSQHHRSVCRADIPLKRVSSMEHIVALSCIHSLVTTILMSAQSHILQSSLWVSSSWRDKWYTHFDTVSTSLVPPQAGVLMAPSRVSSASNFLGINASAVSMAPCMSFLLKRKRP